jgi:hypothetical protein
MKRKDLQRKVISVYEQLARESENNIVTPRRLWQSQVNEDAPLHKQFEWDNDRASDRYRDWQARELMASVTISIKQDGKQTRYFENCIVEISDGTNIQGYASIETIMSNETLKRQVLMGVIAELKRIAAKAVKYSEIYEMINLEAVKKVEQEIADTL